MAKACVDLDRTFRSGDLEKAREKMVVLYRAMNILESGKFVQKIKYGCELQGLPVGNCRAPMGELTAEEKTEFEVAMQPILNW
jgi:4-hydroxy-tetrahydrodipicolinate synthase